MVESEVVHTPNGDTAYVFGPGVYQNHGSPSARASLAYVDVPPVSNKDDYVTFPQDSIVHKVVRELDDNSGNLKYEVTFQTNHSEIIPLERLLEFENGRSALNLFEVYGEPSEDDSEQNSEEGSEDSQDHEIKSRPIRRLRPHKIKSSYLDLGEVVDSEDEITRAPAKLRKLSMRSAARSSQRLKYSPPTHLSELYLSSSEMSSGQKRRNPTRTTRLQHRRSSQAELDFTGLVDEDGADENASSEDVNLLQSDVLPRDCKRKRTLVRKTRPTYLEEVNGVNVNKPRKEATRQSGRSTRHQQTMKELEVDDIHASLEVTRAAPKAVGAREVFQPLPSGDPFHQRHCQQCDTCGKWGGGPYGQLIHCQGCTLSYHKNCIGHRQSRDHLVSKVGEEHFVLQCRRCINVARRRDNTAPDQSICRICRQPGAACVAFRERKTAQQEERDRDENGGKDPIVEVRPSLVNNVSNVMFRCLYCWRAMHFHHLQPRSDVMVVDDDEDTIGTQRYKEYGKDWKCVDCFEQQIKVSTLVAWRPVDPDSYVTGSRVQDVDEDDKEYLVKWGNRSYFQCVWMHGAWVWGVTGPSMRRAFAKRNNSNNLPRMNTEDAIPEEYLWIDIILDVRYTSTVGTRAEEVDKARIVDISQALTKYKGLGYEDVVWEKVPQSSDGARWTDFKLAYDNWVMGRYIHCPKAQALKLRVEKIRSTDFNTLEKKKQSDKLIGGELMQYQLDGVNWLYFRWYKMQNAILADEMGLGKTIQVIGFLATLIQDHNCFPFLLVVPNSTCANWRREIMEWAPSLRVVTYFGSAIARSLAYQHELFPEGSKELRCHIVVTSYEAAADDSCQKFFRSVPWQGLIVDEGQRLKSDKTILYSTLTALKISFKILLTGTPLQNNARELFNLLQFLDDSFNAAELELEYTELTKVNVPQLHNLIRPFFLRRTKAQVLTFLPPLAQIILPVSMSTVQTKLYQSILSRNPELIRIIFDPSRTVGKADRANLNNIFMQLRKCLCHPFVYSKEIEDRSTEAAVSHRNLVEASAKLQMLELLLPKLCERGHRVLIFSQFLDMLDIVEDFLDGLALPHLRLDGSVSSLQKQIRIDEFNAPDSPVFAFLLSTRAGGVGINLATADTVIILDPDFNPHQDIQALSRAHRIGQKNKVLVFQLMTRASAEERIVQVGRKKMALDHLLIEQMDKDDDNSYDMESILRYGAADILEGRTEEIRYDDASIEKLLDRSQIEDTKAGEDNSAESQFSFARVWANDAASLMDSLDSDEDKDKAPDPSVWGKILSERARIAGQEASTRQQVLGRGKRARQTIDYKADAKQDFDRDQDQDQDKDQKEESGSDTDFQADKSEIEDDGNDGEPGAVRDISDSEIKEILEPNVNRHTSTTARRPATDQSSFNRDHVVHQTSTSAPPAIQPQIDGFKRASIVWSAGASQPGVNQSPNATSSTSQHCFACKTWHVQGHCPLKIAGCEHCNLCGLAHFGVARSCPHIRSETQVRGMLEALKQSPESKEHIDLANKYLRGVKGTLVQDKKRRAEKAAYNHALAMGGSSSVTQGHLYDQGHTIGATYGSVSNVPQPGLMPQAQATYGSVSNGHQPGLMPPVQAPPVFVPHRSTTHGLPPYGNVPSQRMPVRLTQGSMEPARPTGRPGVEYQPSTRPKDGQASEQHKL